MLFSDNDVIAVKNAGINHRFAADAKDEGTRVTYDVRGQGHYFLNVLFGENRQACGYATNERESHRVRVDVLLYLCKLWALFGSRFGILADFNRARLIRISFDVAGFFELVEMRVDSRGRGQADS